VLDAQGKKDFDRNDKALLFLKSLGGTFGTGGFIEFHRDRDAQGARYAWLMFAYERAKEQGL
jgi:hypothetical protein